MKKLFIYSLVLFTALTATGQNNFDINEAAKLVNDAEYFITWQQTINAYQSPNRKHNLRTTFNENKVELTPRTNDKSWNIDFGEIGVGRMNSIFKIGKQITHPVATTNSISFSYQNVEVQYVNDNNGLRQNFYINDRVQGIGDLIIDINIQTNLSVNEADGAIWFDAVNNQNIQETQLVYKDIKSWDANGKVLQSSINLIENSGVKQIRLIIQDADAVYPIVVDPLTTSPNFIIEGSTVSSYYIRHVSTGDFNGDGFTDLLTGAPLYSNGQTSEGIVKLYYGLADGTFQTLPSWEYESNIISLNLGDKIANAGDVNNDGYDDILIGCPLYDNVQTNEGIVYLFLGAAGVPASTPNWAVESNSSSAEFGSSIAAAGDVNNDGFDDVVIGAHKHTTSGRAFVYNGGVSGLSLTGTMLNGTGSGSEYGYAVTGGEDINNDGYDDILVSGIWKYDVGGFSSAGKIYVYSGAAAGISTTSSWSYSAKQSNAHLGNAVLMADVNVDGKIDIITSAIDYDSLSQTDNGLIFVFLQGASGLPSQPSQVYFGNQTDQDLGTTLVNLGDINQNGYPDIAIGSPNFEYTSLSEGLIQVFGGGPEGLNFSTTFLISYIEGFAYTGRGLCAAGDTNGDGFDDFILVNSAYKDPNRGTALLYFGNNQINTTFGNWEPSGSTAAFGSTICSLDFNQDGHSDIMVGAPFFDGGSTNEGKVFVYLSNEGGIDPVSDWTAESQQAEANFGNALADIGDINGDGFRDIAIGSNLFDVEEEDDGAVIIYFGNEEHQPNEWVRQILHGGVGYESSGFGTQLAAVGDINDDGYNDIIVSSPYLNTSAGIVSIYPGSEDGILPNPIWQFIYPEQDYANTGISLITQTDINGDDVNDLVISTPSYEGVLDIAEGRIDVFYGTLSGFDTLPAWSEIGTEYIGHLGLYLAGGGDVNGDGFDDFLTTEVSLYTIYEDSVQVKLYYGSLTGPIYSGWHLDGTTFFNNFGGELEMDGDINGDGYDDIFIADIGGVNGISNDGYVYTIFGGLYGPQMLPVVIQNFTEVSEFGNAIEILPDLNGDGADEYFIGAPSEQTGNGTGSVYMYYGTPSPCEPALLSPASTTETTAHFSITGTADKYYYKWKTIAASDWQLDSTFSFTINLSALISCTDHEIIVQAGCADLFSAWSEPLFFTTDCAPCTSAPTGMYVDNITTSSAKLHWAADPDATKYKISFKQAGPGAWTNVNATSNFKTLPGLLPNTTYQYKVKTVCGAAQSPFSPVNTFTTLPLRFSGDEDVLIMMYPNPAKEEITIIAPFSIQSYTITDLLGQVIISNKVENTSSIELQIQYLSSGMYILEVTNFNNGQKVAQPFVKM